jgi:hypothetical protein
MSHEELEAEIATMATEQGFVGGAADGEMGPALLWLHEQALTSVDSLTGDDQAEWRTELGALASSVSGPW